MVLKQEKSQEQLFADLLAMQRDLEKELGAQQRFIEGVQALVRDGGLKPLTVLELFSCPAAVFGPGGVLHGANRALMDHTDLQADEILGGKMNFLDRVTNENFTLLEAAEGVFYGKTALLSRLSYPLELFCKSWRFQASADYHSALLFPLPDSRGFIALGTVMLMK